jgi:uncharacterized repeat protein (TIGR03803 family)
MAKFGLVKTACIIFVVCVATAVASPAQTLDSLHSFDGTDGSFPYGALVQGTDGNFYGTTSAGGASGNCTGCGTVFEITAAGVLTTLHNFSFGNDGATPYGGLVQGTDGNFYGTTGQGGANIYYGTVFKITAAGVLTTLYSFNGSDGWSPHAALVQATDGNFYGTTYEGGTSINGTVFKITPAGTLTTLYNFTGGNDGYFPFGGLVQATDGNFYGTTRSGGANGGGTVFEITAAGVLTTLHNFSFGNDGYSPYGGLVQGTDGNLYGTTRSGGASGNGTVFKITPAGTLTTLHNFSGRDGANPYAGLVQATDGNFYGTTHGTIFAITAAGTLTTLYNFHSGTGANPYARLVQATDGNFYGTTYEGGAINNCGSNGCGTVFSLTISPGVTFSISFLGFGNQVINTTSTAGHVKFSNSGTATLDISSITSSANFAVSSTTCGATLAVKASCYVYVTFTPTISGNVRGILTFTDDALNSPQQTVALFGVGVEPATVTPASATYRPSQTVGTTSAPKTFTLTNNQTTALNNNVISTTGDFALSSTTCTTSLAAKSKCTISVTFTPTQTGRRAGQLSVSDDANNSPQIASLTGTGK